MAENEPITDYAADASIVTAETPAPEPAPTSVPTEITSAGKKRRTKAVAGTAAAETYVEPAPAEIPQIDARIRLEMEAGAAILRANQERLKQVQ